MKVLKSCGWRSQVVTADGTDQLMPFDTSGNWKLGAGFVLPGGGEFPTTNFTIRAVACAHWINGSQFDAYAMVGHSGPNGDAISPFVQGHGHDLISYDADAAPYFTIGEYLDCHASAPANTTHWVTVYIWYEAELTVEAPPPPPPPPPPPGQPYDIEGFVVAGGAGAGGRPHSGSTGSGASGGGGGGVKPFSKTVTPGTSYPVVVGPGGLGAISGVAATNGGNSSFDSVVAFGGGRGGNYDVSLGYPAPGNGGCGGGGLSPLVGRPPGTGTVGQGNAGGLGSNTTDEAGHLYPGGGGGGAGTLGGDASGSTPGKGGDGIANSFTGSPIYYGGGGGGNTFSGTAGLPGLGGGPTANRGGGGNAGGEGANGGPGGSGIVTIRYFGAQRGTGGTVTSVNGYTVHTFLTPGAFIA